MVETTQLVSEYLRICRLPGDLKGENVFDGTGLGPTFVDALLQKGCDILVSTSASATSDGRARLVETARAADQPDVLYDRILLNLANMDPSEWSDQIAYIRTRLSQSGTAYVEFPIAGTLFECRWVPTLVDEGIALSPSYRLIRDTVLQGFAARELGSLVAPLRKRRSMIFACRRLAPTALIFGGESGAGKTTLASLLSSEKSRILHFDFMLHELVSLAEASSNADRKAMFRTIDFSSIGSSVDRIVNSGGAMPFATAIASLFSAADPITVAEGYVFHRAEIKNQVVAILRSRGFRTFTVSADEL